MVVLRSTKDMEVCQMGPGEKAGAESAAKMLGPPPIGEAFFTNVPPTRGGLGWVDWTSERAEKAQQCSSARSALPTQHNTTQHNKRSLEHNSPHATRDTHRTKLVQFCSPLVRAQRLPAGKHWTRTDTRETRAVGHVPPTAVPRCWLLPPLAAGCDAWKIKRPAQWRQKQGRTTNQSESNG